MEWSCKSMMLETLRCLQKTEVDLGVNLEACKAHVHEAVRQFDNTQGKCAFITTAVFAMLSVCGEIGNDGPACWHCTGLCERAWCLHGFF